MPHSRVLFRKSWVSGYLKRYRKVLVFAVVASVVAYIFAAGLMFTSGYMISLAATLPLTVLALHLSSIFVRIFGIGKPIIQYFEKLASHDWVLRMTSDVRRRIFVASEKLAGAISNSLGGMLGLYTEDIEHIQNLYLRSVFPLIELVILYMVVVVAMALFSPLMALLILLVIGICLFVIPAWSVVVNGSRLARQRKIEQQTYENLTSDVIAAADWKLSGRKAEFIGRNQDLYASAHAEQEQVARFNDRLAIAREVLFGLLIAAIALWAAIVFASASNPVTDDGAWFIATGFVDALGSTAALNAEPWALNWVAAFVICAFPLLEAFGIANDAAVDYEKNSACITDLSFIDAQTNGEHDPTNDGSISKYSTQEVKETPAYEICLQPGEHVAVVGRSGSGKTTLLESVFSCKPLDWCNIGFAGKGKHRIGIVEQDPHIFMTTVRENLLIANPNATDEEVIAALDRVNLRSFLNRLPNGLNTIVSEGGTSMSGGERHRLALARILLYNCDVVLLDEPYKHLDIETAKDVSAALLDLFKDKTIIMSTHLILDESDFDRIITLDDLAVVDVREVASR